ncbi:MAG: helix-turn-helix domain-containing protein [Alphaproteobacteria bacterium]|nr:helix-turn-helix domain-containing protein [Alphaproteobacteria bacterium]
MSAPYSMDLRLKVLEDASLKTQKEVAHKWGISTRTLHRWIQRKNKGKIEVFSNSIRKPQKLDPFLLKEYVKQNPDLTIKQIADHFNVWPQAVFYRLNKLKYTYKKRLSLQREVSRKERNLS